MRFYFRCHPRDFEDEGAAAFERLAGEIGVDAVSFEAISDETAALRPRAEAGRRWFRHPGGAWFQPDRQAYASLAVKPAIAAEIKSRNPIEKIASEARARGLALRLGITGCRHPALVAANPHLAARDATGEANRTHMCPAHPEVRAWLAATAADLTTNYPVEALEIETVGLGHEAAGDANLACGMSLPPAARHLLGWSFSPAMRQRAKDAGIDADQVCNRIAERLYCAFECRPLPESTLGDLLASDDALLAYHRVQTEAVTSLVVEIRERCRGRLLLHLPAAPRAAGFDTIAIAQHCDAFVAHVHANETAPVGLDAIIERARFEPVFRCHPPNVTSGDAFVAAVHRRAGAGHAAIGFADYGLAAAPCLDWVRQAIRFARRDAR